MLKQRLEAAREELGIPVTLAAGGKIRITSMCELVRTVLLNQRNLSKMVKDDCTLFRNAEVVAIMLDASWRGYCACMPPGVFGFAAVHCLAYHFAAQPIMIAAQNCCQITCSFRAALQELTILGKLSEPFQRVLLGIQGRQTHM